MDRKERQFLNKTSNWMQSLKRLEAMLLFMAIVAGSGLIIASTDSSLINTLVLFILITVTGLWISNKIPKITGDPKLRVLGSLWLVKLVVILFVLNKGWIPMLDPDTSDFWGYDPQRYYKFSWDLVVAGWDTFEISQNYQGILFYYGGIFAIFGHNPVVPALVNTFLTLLGCLLLIRCAYQFMPNRTRDDWVIAYILLVPESLWYDALTSRESLMSAMIIFASMESATYFSGRHRSNFMTSYVIIFVALFAIISVRTSVIFGVILSNVIFFVLFNTRSLGNKTSRLFLLLFCCIAAILGPILQKITGGYNLNYLKLFESISDAGSNTVDLDWSDNSIGYLLIPNNIIEAIIFIPLRFILYIAAPLPAIPVSFSGLKAGNWVDWQTLMTLPTSLMLILLFPYVLAATSKAWNLRRKAPEMLVIPVVCWSNIIVVSGGNIIIHERYRLMFTILFFACAWIGYTQCQNKLIKNWAVAWLGLLSCLLVGFIFYKYS
jgi:hypothetical protein